MLYEWFQHIEFKNNWILPFLFMLPVFAWLHFRTFSSRKSAFTVTTAEAFKISTFKASLVNLPFWIRLLAIGCIILALARPQKKHQQTKNKGEGIDVILCIDVSGSMLSPDFYPNRLEVAKQVAIDFVKSRPVDQIGLVIFSGESYTQFPLSTDHQTLLEQIRGLRSGMLEDGTLIGEGLATSVDRLSKSRSKSKVVILLTDGKEEAPDTRIIDPVTALGIAKTKGVKVYTIGMSAKTDVGAVQRTTSRIARSKNISFLDEDLLRRIAFQTGGKYFRARDKEGLQQIYEQIDRLEKSEFEVITKTRFEELFYYFIIASLFFLALEMLLNYVLLRTFP
ncbi:MAG: VWA domain-containing protein [Chitinophagaceae bacterium]|nr:VWA domain-containing protein [Chitinophagaceae bacterium]